MVSWKKNQFGSENRTQQISIAGPQPINGGLKEKFVWVRKSDQKISIVEPQPINGGLEEKSVWVRKLDLKNIHRRATIHKW